MEPTSVVDTISNPKKIHYALGLLPLISFIVFEAYLWIIIGYTIVYAIWVVYIYSLVAFKKQAAQTVLNPPKLNKSQRKKINLKNIKEMLIPLRIKLNYIPYLFFFIVTIVLVISAFIYSFYLSIKHLDEDIYSFALFLSHVFFTSFLIFLFLTLNYYKKMINKEKKNKKVRFKKS